MLLCSLWQQADVPETLGIIGVVIILLFFAGRWPGGCSWVAGQYGDRYRWLATHTFGH